MVELIVNCVCGRESGGGVFEGPTVPEAYGGEPLYLRLHVLLELPGPEQHLADGTDWSLAVVQGHLLFTWRQHGKQGKERKRQRMRRSKGLLFSDTVYIWLVSTWGTRISLQ